MEGPRSVIFHAEADDAFVAALEALCADELAVDVMLGDGTHLDVVLVGVEKDVLVAETFDTARADRSTEPVLAPIAEIVRIEVH